MYPEHDKMKKVSVDAQVIGDFIEWLKEQEYIIAKWGEIFDLLLPVHMNTERWLAEYFGIDLTKIDEEKRQMLEEIRHAGNENA